MKEGLSQFNVYSVSNKDTVADSNVDHYTAQISFNQQAI